MAPEGEEDLLYKYYGPVCARYSLKQALRDGVLTPYDYHLRLVHLTDDETQEYVALSEEISRRSAVSSVDDDGSSSDPLLEMLLFKRARLIGAAKNKLPTLSDLLEQGDP